MAPTKPSNYSEEESDEETGTKGPVIPRGGLPKKKWEEEEESIEEVLDSWDAADDSEEEAKKTAKKTAAAEKAAAEAAANKKTKTQRIQEHQAATAAAKEVASASVDDLEDETPAERRERERQRQLTEDLKHAEDLFGAVGIGAGSGGTSTREKPITTADPEDPTKNINLASLPLFSPSTKDGFQQLRETLVPLLTANLKKANYSMFLQEFARNLASGMASEQIRKVASGLTTLANEKQKEEKAAEKGGKKKSAAKPKTNLVAAGKEADKVDTTDYATAQTYDDFDDFM